MELTFNKVGKQYEAEFELAADANLHIEFESATPVKLYQRTTGGGWDLVNDVKNMVGKATDVDLQALIYPKFIKVVCPSNPSYCAVTSDGEVTEIKSQSKVVEITSNGTTSVEPDAGFSYLSKVDVKVDVPQSGGGESGGGSEWKYYDIKDLDTTRRTAWGSLSAIAKFNTGSSIIIMPPLTSYLDNISVTPIAVAINISARLIAEGTDMLLGELITNVYLPMDHLVTEITEEQFYNLES